MPYAAPKPCTHPGCSALVRGGSRCKDHPYTMIRRTAAKEYNKWYKTARWRKNRAAFLAKHPLCVKHEARGLMVPAKVVDHKTPHKGDEVLFWDQTNWQGLCARCHNQKTARQDGGFGNKKR